VATRVFRNSNKRAHGLVSATDILAMSLNVGIIQVAQQTGDEVFFDYVNRFGFGQKSQVDLAHEADGRFNEPGDRNYSEADFAANSFGQGINVTPLQVLSSFATVANRGVRMRPHVAGGFVTDGRVAYADPEAVQQVISPEAASLLTEMMIVAVERGAPEALIDECDVAGKTGTAEIAHETGYYEEITIASFGAFAPAQDPAFACLIKLDKPQTSIWGAETAAPVFREIGPRILKILRVRPTGARHNAGVR
jgi:cell division protein FtsI/penicillin-binding protein 2